MLEWLLVITTALTFAILNSFLVIFQWFKNPPGYLFTGIAHYYSDYFLYVSQLAQGAAGHIFSYSHRFTNEPLPATWIWWFNGLLGYLGHLFGLSVFSTYNLALGGLVITLVFLWHFIARLFYPHSRFGRLTFLLFILTASSFFDFKKFLGTGTIDVLGYFWFSPTQAFNRLGGVPHQIWQTILLTLLALVFIKNLKRKFIKLVGLVGLTVLATTANPIQILVFVCAAGLTTLWLILKNKHFDLPTVAPLLLVVGAALPSAWLTNQAFNTLLFQTVKTWEANQIPYLKPSDFLFSLGPIVLFIPFGFIGITKKLTALSVFFLSFTATSISLFWSPLPEILVTAPSRYLSPTIYVGLAALATDGLGMLMHWTRKRRLSQRSLRSLLPAALLVIFTLIYVFFTLVSLIDQVTNRSDPRRYPVLISYANHVPKPIVDALSFLKAQPFGPRPVVVTEPEPGLPVETLIPVLSDKITFTGHPLHTLYNSQKEALVAYFFSGALSQDRVKTFFNTYRIGYLLTKSDPLQPFFFTSFPFIQKIYEAEGIAIYRINLP